MDSCFFDGCFFDMLLLGWLLLPFNLYKTPLGETGCLGNPYFLFTGCLSIQFFDSPLFKHSKATSVYLLLTAKHLCYLRDVMPHHWSPGTFHSPFMASATGLREYFLLPYIFYLTHLPAAFKASLGLTVHPQRQQGFMLIIETAQAQLLPQITPIHKKGILVGSIYVPKASFEVKVPQPWNLPLAGFEPVFRKALCVSICVS